MKITVNVDECIGAAMCTGLAPKVFGLSEEGLVALLDEEPPQELRERLERAVGACPVSAIRMQD
ncbi:ferredoxin [Streptomyces sp. NPDC002795]|uniref:ferredoxin n=1 Tax=Streptomyces sp. NPDC002795 TaxID=3364665 RepID=UPI0036CDC386